MSSRLKSRLFAGLNIGIQLPGSEARWAMVRFAVERAKLRLDQKRLARLVEITSGLPPTNVAAVVLANQTTDAPITTARSDQQISRLIIRTTAKRFGAKVRDLHGASRRKSVVVPRAVAMFLIRECTSLSLVEIGQLFRRRDHTTVRHACLKIQKQIAVDPDLRDVVAGIRETVNGIPPLQSLDAAG